MKSYHTNRRTVRRFLLDKQHLLSQKENPAKEETLQIIRQLECVQLDAVASVARNQHLVLAARVPDYQPEILDDLLAQGQLFEYWANAACTIPMEDYPKFEATRLRFQNQSKEELDKLGSVVDDVLDKLRREGPLPSRAFKAENRVHGAWDNKSPNTKETSHALNQLLDTGIIRVVSRVGSERFFDLTERTIPKNLLQEADKMDSVESNEALLEKYMQAYRVFDAGDPRLGWQKMSAAQRREAITKRVETGSIIPLEMDDVHRQYYILADDLDLLKKHEKLTPKEESSTDDVPIRFLPPLDNLLWRRERLVDLFDFSYKWEVYTPKAKRKYGYYAMPILAGDRLIGRIDPGLDRENQHLNVRLLQIEHNVNMTPQLRNNLKEAIESFASFHHAETITIDRAMQDIQIF
ncbi:winged helix-turn-helix domain-containing protein [Virgibacillus sp. JSM 102003]|uniref:winged helix-turn-helix domain-containing protein n=1 Tax=Virgibacillus sp. JSM 102003 TaxID=1562108 RepID=UPI0035BF337D